MQSLHKMLAFVATVMAGPLFICDAANAQEVESPVDPTVSQSPNRSLATDFGPSGLLAEFNSNENFGNVQARLGVYRTHQSASDAGGPAIGYRDDFENVVIPLKATISLLGSDRQWFVRVASTAAFARGQPGNFTRTSTDSRTGQIHLIRRFGSRTALGVGMIATNAQVELLHNGGSLSNDGLGLQLDVMHKITPQFGIAGRLIHDSVDRRINLPLPGGAVSVTRRNGSRTYAEASLVYSIGAQRSALAPDGWRLRPVITGVFQTTDFEEGRTGNGNTLPRTQEDYAAALLTTRIERAAFTPWTVFPYAEMGLELLLRNEASQVDTDPSNSYLRAGVAMNVGGNGRLDLYAIRRDSFEGTFSATNFSVLLSLQF